MVLGLITAGLAIAGAALLASSIDSAFTGGADAAAIGGTLAALAAVLAGRALVAWAGESVAHRCSASVKSSLRMRLLECAAGLGPRWSTGARSGEVVALATRGLDALDPYFAQYLPQLVLAAIVPLAVVACLAAVDIVAALTVALTVPLIPVFMVLIGNVTERQRRRRWSALSRLAYQFLDVVAGLPTLRAFGRAHGQLAHLERVTDDYRHESMATLRVAFLSALALELAATLSVALVAVGIGLRLVAGDLDLRTGLFILVLAPEAYLPLRQLGLHYHASEEGLSAAAAAFDIIEAKPAAAGGRLPVPEGWRGGIRVESVTCLQPGRALAAPYEASFDIGPGDVVAVAGGSGAGKTTLLQVILGLVPADEGRVLLTDRTAADGGGRGSGALAIEIAVSALDREDWHRHVAWVPQAPFLFAGTISENARLGRPDAPDAEVRAALADVGLGEIDPALRLGEGGIGLSSGQRRRVGVARALLGKRPLLLLDEPTAGLDAAAESAVLRAIRDAARSSGSAVILVAHRPAALAIADRVVTVVAREGPAAAGTGEAATRRAASPAVAAA